MSTIKTIEEKIEKFMREIPHRVRTFFHEENGIVFRDYLFKSKTEALEFLSKIRLNSQAKSTRFFHKFECHTAKLFDQDDQPVEFIHQDDHKPDGFYS